MSPDTKQTSPPAADAEGPAPTEIGSVPTAPHSRRGDHLLAASVGAILSLTTLPFVAIASTFAAEGRLPLALLSLALVLAAWTATQALFAARSSFGGLVAGIVTIAAQLVVLVAPRRGSSVPFDWAQGVIPSGVLCIISALFIGGAVGMRRARRAGRAAARLALRMAAEDRTMGRTPSAPPSRRREHIASFPATLATVLLALYLLRYDYAALVTGDDGASWLQLLPAYVLLALAAGFTGYSTLGARAVGPLLVLAGSPALLGAVRPGLPGHDLLARWLPDDPTGISLITSGLLLIALGWGSHLARRQGRATELAALRASSTTTPASGIPLPEA